MCRVVEITYNPYLPRMNILVDGETLSEYSRLIQYTDMDIWDWARQIFDAVYVEFGSDYYICFCGTDKDYEIVKYYGMQYQHCKYIKYIRPALDIGIQKRLVMMNQLLKKENIRNFCKTTVFAEFVLDNEADKLVDEINSIEVANKFCSVCICGNFKPVLTVSPNSHYIFYITRDPERADQYQRKENCKNPVFIIVIGKEKSFSGIRNDGYLFTTTEENLIDTIFECFLVLPLVRALRNCMNSIKGQYAGQTVKIASMEPTVRIELKQIIEEGCSNPITIIYDSPADKPPRIIFQVRDQNVAVTDNLCVYGKHSGTTKLEAYQYGEKIPFEVLDIEVVHRNRIRTIVLDETSIFLGEGDQYVLGADCAPDDADNFDEVKWTSSDLSVASVNNGVIRGTGTGECMIFCTAENVSAKCLVTVKPYLQEIRTNLDISDNGILYMLPAEEIPMQISLFPQDSIDSEVRISSSDRDIVNPVNHKLIAKNIGTAQVTISNNSGRIVLNIQIVVSKRKRSGRSEGSSKGGFLKGLFGRH